MNYPSERRFAPTVLRTGDEVRLSDPPSLGRSAKPLRRVIHCPALRGNIVGGWHKQSSGDLPLYWADEISGLPGIVQGFTTRLGGVSTAPYDTLNMGTHVGDASADVRENRQRLWTHLGFIESQVALAQQVHRDAAAVVTGGTPDAPAPGADALVTNTPGVLLMLFFADCVPVYLVDPVRRAVGLAHAGWRGTAANIAGKTVQTLTDEFGCRPDGCLAAIGPGIAGNSYEVGPEVADRFRALPAAQTANAVSPCREATGASHLDLRAIIFEQLQNAGVHAERIAVCDQDTYTNQRDFFSYRRDGVTGRMAAFLGINWEIKGNKTG